MHFVVCNLSSDKFSSFVKNFKLIVNNYISPLFHLLEIALIYDVAYYRQISYNLYIALAGPGYQNVIDREDYTL